MIIRAVREEERVHFNSVVTHPLQTWEWGEFRKQTGIQVERIGFFEESKLVKALQITFHPLPLIGKTLGYVPKSFMPDEEQLDILKQLGIKHNALFIKLEPDVSEPVGSPSGHEHIAEFLAQHNALPGKPLFTKYTFKLDLTQPLEQIFNNLSSKTRYNVNLAEKKGVQIFENSTELGMEQYIEILEETTKRQGFYAHSPDYFRTLWKQLGNSGMLKIFNAVYNDTVIVSWIMFIHNKVLYYPYGSSRALYREVMASNLMMWQMIKFGKESGCTTFDMWGALGPDPDEKDPWYGFHRFKKGYGATLMEFIGTYDLILNDPLYKLFTIVESIRWKWLKLQARFRR